MSTCMKCGKRTFLDDLLCDSCQFEEQIIDEQDNEEAPPIPAAQSPTVAQAAEEYAFKVPPPMDIVDVKDAFLAGHSYVSEGEQDKRATILKDGLLKVINEPPDHDNFDPGAVIARMIRIAQEAINKYNSKL